MAGLPPHVAPRPTVAIHPGLAGIVGLVLLAGCIGAPSAEDWMAVGFRSPEQTLRTFQTAVRADAPDLEFRCLSDGFRRRNGLSKLAWREAREELRARFPWMRLGIVDAEIESRRELSAGRVELTLVSHGRSIAVRCVREDFAELWSGATPLYDDLIDFNDIAGVEHASDGRDWFVARVALPPGGARGEDVTELHAGREWKIDSIAGDEPADRP